MSRLELWNCSLIDAGIIAIAASINKINQLKIYSCDEISMESCDALAKNICERNSPVS